jgi:hypothetical protein
MTLRAINANTEVGALFSSGTARTASAFMALHPSYGTDVGPGDVITEDAQRPDSAMIDELATRVPTWWNEEALMAMRNPKPHLTMRPTTSMAGG